MGTAVIRELVPLPYVDAIGESVAFYRDKLGFRVAQVWEPEGRLAWCRLARDGTARMLQQACEEDGPAEGRGRGVGFFFNCDDAPAIYAELRKRGLEVDTPQTPFYGMNQLFIRDPDGYELCFQSSAAAS